ncbi:MAG: carbohydrate-binding domain-containing protein [Oscillospiraceae bacterium]|nr:carbohydrate-binding domain-containing protein [Oscillospiraceae bacterium]
MKQGCKRHRWSMIALSAALALSLLSGCGSGTAEQTEQSDGTADAAAAETAAANLSASAREAATVDLTNAVTVQLNGDSATADGSGVSVADAVITVSSGGTYLFTGTLNDGRILVDAQGEDVILVFNGADITCSYGSPLYIYKSASTTLHLMEGTSNSLTDGESYTFADGYSSEVDEEPNACLYSKSDLVLQGAGALTVNANCNNGITSKDTLEIYDLTLTVNAVNHGINGKDSALVDSASVTVVCGGDALRSTNDTDSSLGWLAVTASTLELTAGEDGIQAETDATFYSGSYTIRSGGGSTVQPSDETSTKGIKSGGTLTILDGSYDLDCSDDAVHSNGDVTVSGGTFVVSTGDDAFHADGALTISDGTFQILTSYEGLEGLTVEISGGTFDIYATDDGVNAAGGADASGFGGFGGGNTFGGGEASSDYYINISGGYLVVEAGGDGMDSNGTIDMSGGTVIVSSTGMGDGAIDCEMGFTLTGGTLLAMDAGAMSMTPNNPAQYTVFLAFGETLPAGTCVALTGENQSFVFQLPTSAATLLFSSAELEADATYTVSYGGDYSASASYFIFSGGDYSGGTALTELTLTETLTSYGSAGMGMGGGMGMNMGGGRGQNGGRGDMAQPDGEMTPPDGETGAADGEMTFPDGEMSAPDGEMTAPDGGGMGGGRGQGGGPGGMPGADGEMGEMPGGETGAA